MQISPGDLDPTIGVGTERLILRPMTASDVAALLAGAHPVEWAEDFPQPSDVDTARMLEYGGGAFDVSTAFGQLAIVERQSGLVVGLIGFEGPPIDGVGELICSVCPSRRNQGYATEATTALVDFAFSFPEIGAVQASTPWDDEAAQRVLLKCGFTAEDDDADETFERGYRRERPATV
ncbi:hypothetical protein GCM10011512_16980 [Tersicoccus solisilvae]|uniref:N-acetyltransferase domain-containing protein n=1 Tax=Tersicoccus solisilvae TaxID=1882339 RepID=A0ABQ1P4F5_9MICC|nr:GNAT family protein [Tersicoccus solisilvae]GGC90586.1 hypothetical protein GCM10011512_16980 [Tersicoccus solisilvae]